MTEWIDIVYVTVASLVICGIVILANGKVADYYYENKFKNWLKDRERTEFD